MENLAENYQRKLAENYHQQLLNLARMTGYTMVHLDNLKGNLQQVIKYYKTEESDGWCNELKEVINKLEDIKNKMDEIWERKEEENIAKEILHKKSNED